jgi:hypothetical protein
MDEREAARFRVHAAVRGRYARRAAIEETGATEVEALEALRARLEVRVKVMR